MKNLTGSQSRLFRDRTHALEPAGQNGHFKLADSTRAKIDRALIRRELMVERT